MRKIIVGAMVSIDGVMQAPGGPSEDPTRGFRFGGWVMPYFDDVFGEELDAYWPYYDESGPDGGIARRFNEIKKYIVSGSGDVDTGWQRSVLLRDLEAVRRVPLPSG